MDSSNPKVSFIPKGSLVRDESFLTRSRPRSLLGVIAGVIFVVAIGTFFGLRYYNVQLNQKIAENTLQLENVQKKFNTAPEVGEAKVFLTRANLAREILDAHVVLSPVLEFLSENTTEHIFYNKFSFKNSIDGLSLTLSGESPSYATLAYQSDVLRSRTKELQKFSVKDVTLTRAGTITFSFDFVFRPSYLLYIKQFSSVTPVDGAPSISGSTMPLPGAPSTDTTPVQDSDVVTPPASTTAPVETSVIFPTPDSSGIVTPVVPVAPPYVAQ